MVAVCGFESLSNGIKALDPYQLAILSTQKFINGVCKVAK